MYSTNILNNRTFLTAGFIGLALILATPTFAAKVAAISPIKSVIISELNPPTGTITCPGSPVSGVGLIVDFFVPKPVSSQGILLFVPGVTDSVAQVTKFQISPNNFKLSGTVPFDGICPLTLTPTTFSLTGPCGLGVTVQYSDASGVRGIFPVACTA